MVVARRLGVSRTLLLGGPTPRGCGEAACQCCPLTQVDPPVTAVQAARCQARPRSGVADLGAESRQGTTKKARHLHLADADLLCDLTLGELAIEPKETTTRSCSGSPSSSSGTTRPVSTTSHGSSLDGSLSSSSARWALAASSARAIWSTVTPRRSASSAGDGTLPSSLVSSPVVERTATASCLTDRGTRMSQPSSRKCCLSRPSMTRAA